MDYELTVRMYTVDVTGYYFEIADHLQYCSTIHTVWTLWYCTVTTLRTDTLYSTVHTDLRYTVYCTPTAVFIYFSPSQSE